MSLSVSQLEKKIFNNSRSQSFESAAAVVRALCLLLPQLRHTVLSLNEYLDYVRSAPGDEIELLLSRAIPWTKLPSAYIQGLSTDDRIAASRACLLA